MASVWRIRARDKARKSGRPIAAAMWQKDVEETGSGPIGDGCVAEALNRTAAVNAAESGRFGSRTRGARAFI